MRIINSSCDFCENFLFSSTNASLFQTSSKLTSNPETRKDALECLKFLQTFSNFSYYYHLDFFLSMTASIALMLNPFNDQSKNSPINSFLVLKFICTNSFKLCKKLLIIPAYRQMHRILWQFLTGDPIKSPCRCRFATQTHRPCRERSMERHACEIKTEIIKLKK